MLFITYVLSSEEQKTAQEDITEHEENGGPEMRKSTSFIQSSASKNDGVSNVYVPRGLERSRFGKTGNRGNFFADPEL